MREFKFRAWRHDGEYSHMIESPIGVYTALKHCLGVATSAGFSDCPNEPRKDGYTLMQCIGRKDKNGREIYECDIIRDNKGRILEVFWNELSLMWWFLEVRNGDKYHIEKMDWEDIEVIGNIFQNPELLEVMECSEE